MSHFYKALWAFIWIVTVIDVGWFLSREGHPSDWEANPVVRVAIERFGVAAVVGYRLLMVFLCWILAMLSHTKVTKACSIFLGLVNAALLSIYIVLWTDVDWLLGLW